jgi:hypothetical protein
MTRQCAFRLAAGQRCRAAPLKDGPFCIVHAPEHQEAMQEARRLGGLRRRREATLSGAYDVQGLGSVQDILRLVEIAVLDALGLENSVARVRALLYAAQVAAKLLETGELEQRLATLEALVLQQDHQERRSA